MQHQRSDPAHPGAGWNLTGDPTLHVVPAAQRNPMHAKNHDMPCIPYHPTHFNHCTNRFSSATVVKAADVYTPSLRVGRRRRGIFFVLLRTEWWRVSGCESRRGGGFARTEIANAGGNVGSSGFPCNPFRRIVDWESRCKGSRISAVGAASMRKSFDDSVSRKPLGFPSVLL